MHHGESSSLAGFFNGPRTRVARLRTRPRIGTDRPDIGYAHGGKPRSPKARPFAANDRRPRGVLGLAEGDLLVRVEVHSVWSLENHSCFLGVDAVGAGVVDEEGEPVGGEPDVAAFAALA